MIFWLANQPIEAVMSCRKNGLGISSERAQIEKFELYLLSQLYGIDLPDGQCGLWGLKGDFLQRAYLSADGFEIELDTNSVKSKPKAKFGFIPVRISESETTTFNVQSHRKKIVFICQKLGIGKDLIMALANKFEERNCAKLPVEYIDMLNSLTKKRFRLFTHRASQEHVQTVSMVLHSE